MSSNFLQKGSTWRVAAQIEVVSLTRLEQVGRHRGWWVHVLKTIVWCSFLLNLKCSLISELCTLMLSGLLDLLPSIKWEQLPHQTRQLFRDENRNKQWTKLKALYTFLVSDQFMRNVNIKYWESLMQRDRRKVRLHDRLIPLRWKLLPSNSPC